jgi:hypothetical protein
VFQFELLGGEPEPGETGNDFDRSLSKPFPKSNSKLFLRRNLFCRVRRRIEDGDLEGDEEAEDVDEKTFFLAGMDLAEKTTEIFLV